MGVRPSLPIEGINVIFGNNLAGERVWSVSPSPVVSNRPSIVGIPDESAEVFSVCAVTRSMSLGDLATAPANDGTNICHYIPCYSIISALPACLQDSFSARFP